MKYGLSYVAIALLFLFVAVRSPAKAADSGSKPSAGGSTKVTLTIGNKVVPAVLYNSTAAKNLMSRLPITVSLNKGSRDYCGGIDPLNYEKNEVQTGYRNGDLAYWIPGQDFVIFTEGEETSFEVPDVIILGHINVGVEGLKGLGHTVKVSIALDR